MVADPCPGGWRNFRSGSGCQAMLVSAFLGGRTYTIAPDTIQIVVNADEGPFVSTPNPAIANQAALLVWLNAVLVEASNQGLTTFGIFRAIGGYLLPAKIEGLCVTQVVPAA